MSSQSPMSGVRFVFGATLLAAFVSCGSAHGRQPVVVRWGHDLDLKMSTSLVVLQEQQSPRRGLDVIAPPMAGPVSRLALLKLASDNSKVGLVAKSGGGGKLGLGDLIDLAVQAHPEVTAKRAELGGARAGQDAARWQYYPTPSLQVRQQDRGSNVTVASVQQPLWSGGRLDAGLDAADSRVRSADVAISEMQYTLALRVVSAWQSWMQARGRVEALGKGMALLGAYGETVRQRIKGGVSPEVDRELVESRLAQTQGDLTTARAAERSALSQMSQLIGRPLRADELSLNLGVADNVPALERQVERSVLASAALRRIEAEVEAAHHDATQKRASLWPTLALRAEYQYGDLNNTGVISDYNRVMLVMDYVPGAGLSSAAGIDAAEARVLGLRENLEASRRDLVSKVAADYEDYVSSRGRERDIRRTLKAASEVLASYDRLFVAGKRSWLDVLNAAREVTQVQTSLADVEAQLAASQYRLRLHAGELSWQQGVGS